jgi:ribonuclease P protein component
LELDQHEANVSTEPTTPEEDPRLPRANEDDRWTECPEATTNEGTRTNQRLKGPTKRRFDQVFTEGKRASGPLARLISLPGTGLLGIATSKKIGSKPPRNRAKRRFREAIRTQNLVDSALDYVLVVQTSGADAPFERIQEEMRRLFQEAGKRWASELESS